jgi:hypothetical protein
MRTRLLITLLALSFATVACGGDKSVFDLSVGDCFDDDPDAGESVSSVATVECSEPHDNEIYFEYSMTESTFPGREATTQAAAERCIAEFRGLRRTVLPGIRSRHLPDHPTLESWGDGDRVVYCALYALDLSKLTGSMRRQPVRSIRSAVVVSVLLASCTTQGAATTTTGATTTVAPVTTAPSTTLAPTTTVAVALPPHTYEALAPLLDPMVEPLGFRVTRAALVSLLTYESVPDGTHLAVYVEPLAEPDIEAVAAATVPLAAVFLPEVFLRWPGLLSFDICQERFAASTEDAPPPPETILNVTREVALGIDWDTVTLTELLAQRSTALTLYASDEVTQSATWSAAAGM